MYNNGFFLALEGEIFDILLFPPLALTVSGQ